MHNLILLTLVRISAWSKIVNVERKSQPPSRKRSRANAFVQQLSIDNNYHCL